MQQRRAEVADVDMCPASGRDAGRMIEIPGSDDWKIACPDCGAWWHGGGIRLPRHQGEGPR